MLICIELKQDKVHSLCPEISDMDFYRFLYKFTSLRDGGSIKVTIMLPCSNFATGYLISSTTRRSNDGHFFGIPWFVAITYLLIVLQFAVGIAFKDFHRRRCAIFYIAALIGLRWAGPYYVGFDDSDGFWKFET